MVLCSCRVRFAEARELNALDNLSFAFPKDDLIHRQVGISQSIDIRHTKVVPDTVIALRPFVRNKESPSLALLLRFVTVEQSWDHLSILRLVLLSADEERKKGIEKTGRVGYPLLNHEASVVGHKGQRGVYIRRI